jgi:hypothetical protein
MRMHPQCKGLPRLPLGSVSPTAGQPYMGVPLSTLYDAAAMDEAHQINLLPREKGPGLQPGAPNTGAGDGSKQPSLPWAVVLENIWHKLSFEDRCSICEVCKDALYIARTRLQTEVNLLVSGTLAQHLVDHGETVAVRGL